MQATAKPSDFPRDEKFRDPRTPPFRDEHGVFRRRLAGVRAASVRASRRGSTDRDLKAFAKQLMRDATIRPRTTPSFTISTKLLHTYDKLVSIAPVAGVGQRSIPGEAEAAGFVDAAFEEIRRAARAGQSCTSS